MKSETEAGENSDCAWQKSEWRIKSDCFGKSLTAVVKSQISLTQSQKGREKFRAGRADSKEKVRLEVNYD